MIFHRLWVTGKGYERSSLISSKTLLKQCLEAEISPSKVTLVTKASV